MILITRRVLVVAGAAALLAVPARAQTDTPSRLALKGFDPVAYFSEGAPRRGSGAYTVLWDGARWHFASQQNLEAFRADPDRYAPQFAGSCAMRMSAGERVEADPGNWLIRDGKLFVFATPRGPAAFAADESRGAMAERNWAALRDAPARR